MKRYRRGLALFLIVALSLSLTGFRLHATSGVITVTTTEDQFGTVPGECSLREAIQAANTQATYDGCVVGSGWTDYQIQLGSGSYTLTRAGADDLNATGDLDIIPIAGQIITITGISYETDVNGNALDRIFDVKAATDSFVGIYSLRITNGATLGNGAGVSNAGRLDLQDLRVDNNVGPGGYYYGAGISNTGIMTITDALIDNNRFEASAHNGGGGGIYNGSGGTLALVNVTVADNAAGDVYFPGFSTSGGSGGGIKNEGTLTIMDSAIVHNRGGDCLDASTCSGGAGGGIFTYQGSVTIDNSTISGNSTGVSINLHSQGGGIFNWSSMEIHDTTIAYNSIGASQTNQQRAGGIYNNATLILGNTIVAMNDAQGFADDCYGLSVTSEDYNLIYDTDGCTFTGTTSHHIAGGIDPHLMSLDFYGGPNENHMLAWNSPAIDAGDPDHCPDFDQRGVARPWDGDLDGSTVCDIGAVEADWTYFGFLPIISTFSIAP